MTRRTKSLSVIIPAYNEEDRLPRTLAMIHDWLRAGGWDFEILAVDDGSLDRTSAAVQTVAADRSGIRVLRYPVNHGKGFAVRAGMLAATRPAALFLDADHAAPISELDRLWPQLEEGCDVVIGSRSIQGADIRRPQPLHRRIMGRAFHGVVSLAGLREIRDTQCGFKLFTAAAARSLFGALRTLGFAFDVEILLRARRLGLKVRELPIQWSDDVRSRVSPVRDSARMLLDVLGIWRRA